MGDITEHFSYREFACPCGDCEGNGLDISIDLVNALQNIRYVYEKPVRITSGVRCSSHNEAIGGKPDSEHLTGEAVDIAVRNSRERHGLLELLFIHFNRIGIGKDFIHLGVSPSKIQDVVWVYS